MVLGLDELLLHTRTTSRANAPMAALFDPARGAQHVDADSGASPFGSLPEEVLSV